MTTRKNILFTMSLKNSVGSATWLLLQGCSLWVTLYTHIDFQQARKRCCMDSLVRPELRIEEGGLPELRRILGHANLQGEAGSLGSLPVH